MRALVCAFHENVSVEEALSRERADEAQARLIGNGITGLRRPFEQRPTQTRPEPLQRGIPARGAGQQTSQQFIRPESVELGTFKQARSGYIRAVSTPEQARRGRITFDLMLDRADEFAGTAPRLGQSLKQKGPQLDRVSQRRTCVETADDQRFGLFAHPQRQRLPCQPQSLIRPRAGELDEADRKSTRLNSSHVSESRMP